MTGGEVVYPGDPLAPGFGRLILAPATVVVHGEEWLRLTIWNAVAGVTVELSSRTLGPDPTAQVSAKTLTPTSNRLSNTLDLYPGTGALLNIGVRVTAGSPRIGQTFAQVSLIRGSGSAAQPIAVLMAGDLTSIQALGWPGSPVAVSTQLPPVLRVIQGATPGAGIPYLETCPTGARWQLLSFSVGITTSAAAGNRQSNLEVQDPVVGRLQAYPQVDVCAPSSGKNWFWMAGMALGVTLTPQGPGCQGLDTNGYILAGQTLTDNGTGLQAGDQFTAPRYTVLEWLEGQ